MKISPDILEKCKLEDIEYTILANGEVVSAKLVKRKLNSGKRTSELVMLSRLDLVLSHLGRLQFYRLGMEAYKTVKLYTFDEAVMLDGNYVEVREPSTIYLRELYRMAVRASENPMSVEFVDDVSSDRKIDIVDRKYAKYRRVN